LDDLDNYPAGEGRRGPKAKVPSFVATMMSTRPPKRPETQESDGDMVELRGYAEAEGRERERDRGGDEERGEARGGGERMI
jgi:hypothetical protein